MTPEELAELWQVELSKADESYKLWEDFTDNEKQLGISVATKVLGRLSTEIATIASATAAEILNRYTLLPKQDRNEECLDPNLVEAGDYTYQALIPLKEVEAPIHNTIKQTEKDKGPTLTPELIGRLIERMKRGEV